MYVFVYSDPNTSISFDSTVFKPRMLMLHASNCAFSQEYNYFAKSTIFLTPLMFLIFFSDFSFPWKMF